jgi:MFS family permease
MDSQWNLVCDKGPKRATTHMALSLGKMLGAGILGVSADRYGRRGVYALGIVLFVVAGPVSAFVPWYWAFVMLRLVTGLGFSAIQFSSLTTREFARVQCPPKVIAWPDPQPPNDPPIVLPPPCFVALRTTLLPPHYSHLLRLTYAHSIIALFHFTPHSQLQQITSRIGHRAIFTTASLSCPTPLQCYPQASQAIESTLRS